MAESSSRRAEKSWKLPFAAGVQTQLLCCWALATPSSASSTPAVAPRMPIPAGGFACFPEIQLSTTCEPIHTKTKGKLTEFFADEIICTVYGWEVVHWFWAKLRRFGLLAIVKRKIKRIKSMGIQSNLNLRTLLLFTYFRFTYCFNVLLNQYIRTQIWFTYFVLRTLIWYTYFEYVKQSAYIEFKYVLRVILSFQFCKFYDFLFWVRHADEWQSTCSNSIERRKYWWLQVHFTVRFTSFSKVWF